MNKLNSKTNIQLEISLQITIDFQVFSNIFINAQTWKMTNFCPVPIFAYQSQTIQKSRFSTKNL